MTRILASIAAMGLLAFAGACTSTEKTAQGNAPQSAAQPAASPAPPTPAEKTDRFAWGTGWKLQVVPVFSGGPLKDGAGTVTMGFWDGGPRLVSYDFPAVTSNAVRPEVAKAAGDVLRPVAAKGQIKISESAARAGVFTPPMFWKGGEATAQGPLVWFSPDVVATLRDKHTAAMQISPLGGGSPQTVTLTVQGTGDVVLSVNGKATRFSAVRIRDDKGSLYTLLDAPQNPLIVRFRFGSAPSINGKTITLATQSGYDVVALESPAIPAAQ